MFRGNKENAKFNLQGRIFKSFCVILFSSLSFVVFVLSCISCMYLLVVNTDFLSSIGVFDNQIALITVCAFAVMENIVLLLLHIYLKLKKDVYFYYFDESENIRILLNTVCKALSIYMLKFIKKLFMLIFFISPFSAILVLIFSLLKSGVSYFTLTIFLIADLFLFTAGICSYIAYIQKYHLLPLVLFENQDENIREIFKLSAEKMNGICKDTAKLKICNFPKRVLSLFVLPMVYYLPLCRAIESDFALKKEIPHMRRKAYAEKPIVFYFKQITEN